jgi:hypothetical protein
MLSQEKDDKISRAPQVIESQEPERSTSVEADPEEPAENQSVTEGDPDTEKASDQNAEGAEENADVEEAADEGADDENNAGEKEVVKEMDENGVAEKEAEKELDENGIAEKEIEKEPDENDVAEKEIQRDELAEDTASASITDDEAITTLDGDDLPTPQLVKVDMTGSEQISEVETIESAFPTEQKRKSASRRRLGSLVSDFKTDLESRARSVEREIEEEEKERSSPQRQRKAESIVEGQRELLDQNRLVARWTHFPMSRVMEREYAALAIDRIRDQWHQALEVEPDLEVRVRLMIAKSGKILKYDFTELSPNRYFNQVIAQIFKDLVQLPPLPDGFTGESTEIGFRFTPKRFNSE